MKKSLIALLHIGFWLCYFLLVIIILGVLYGKNEATADAQIAKGFQIILFFAMIPSAISFYGFYYFLFPRYFQKKKYILSVLYGILISEFGAIIGWICLYYLNKDVECNKEENITSIFLGMVTFISVIALICGVIALVIRGFITWFEDIKQKEILKQKNLEMEMALIKSQLDPHFLFNTINNIDVLILKDAEQASNYLNHLSDIMRFMLFETKSKTIPLYKEIEYIEKYIELQKIRTSNELYVNFNVTGSSTNKSIAPMIFISFIENAFKHTNNKKIEHAIEINLNIEDHSTHFICNNKYDCTKNTQDCHGLGNVLITKRLELIYPEKHTLDISNKENQFSVSLKIDHG